MPKLFKTLIRHDPLAQFEVSIMHILSKALPIRPWELNQPIRILSQFWHPRLNKNKSFLSNHQLLSNNGLFGNNQPILTDVDFYNGQNNQFCGKEKNWIPVMGWSNQLILDFL